MGSIVKKIMTKIEVIDIPKIKDYRGNLAVVEKDTIPFKIERVYYLFDVPSDAYRGGHAHIEQEELLVALSGSFEVILKDGEKTHRIMLNKPDKGLIIPKMTWRELENFSSGSVCLVLASGVYTEDDYIRDYDKFLLSKRG